MARVDLEYVKNHLLVFERYLRMYERSFDKEKRLQQKCASYAKKRNEVDEDNSIVAMQEQVVVEKSNVENNSTLDIYKYLKLLLNTTKKEEVEKMLISFRNNKHLISLLILELLKEKREASELALMDRSLNEEILEYIDSIDQKLEWLDEIKEQEEYEEEFAEESIKPTYLVFLENENEQMIFLKGIKKIPQEYYPDILVMLEDLKSLKNVKYKHIYTIGCHEMRRDNLRIFYRKYENTQARYILVLDCIVKKVNSSSYYRSYLNSMMQVYKREVARVIKELETSLDEESDIFVNQEDIIIDALEKGVNRHVKRRTY